MNRDRIDPRDIDDRDPTTVVGGVEKAGDKDLVDNPDANLDPISGETGAHPVGTGIGAAGVGTAATVIGAVVGGPIGGVVGAVVGSVVGGLAGKQAAEKINPTEEDEHWRDNYTTRPYVEEGRAYEDYQPAYRTGYQGYIRYVDAGKTYDQVEPELRKEYEAKGSSNVDWNAAKYAVRDGWDRASRYDKP